MRIFLGFRHAQLRATSRRDDGAKHVVEALGREQRPEEGIKLRAVLGHASRRREPDDAPALEPLEVGIEHGGEDLAHAIGAEIDAKYAVAILHAGIVANDRGLDEFVALVMGVAVEHGGERIGETRALGVDHHVIGARDALPAIVAVHGPITTTDGGDASRGRQGRQKSLDVLVGRARRRIASVGQRVNEYRHASRGHEGGERRGMILMGVHAAGRDQPHDVASAVRGAQLFDEFAQSGDFGQTAALDRVRDARQVLHDDPTRADVQVANLGIAHLAARQSHVLAGCIEEGMGACIPEPGEGGRIGLTNGVVGALLAPAPAIEDHEHHWTFGLHGRILRFGAS